MLDDPPAGDIPSDIRRPDRLRPSVAWLRDWVMWFGAGRLVATAVAVLGIAVAGWWLVRTPATPTEAMLPMASAPSTSTVTPAPGSVVGDAASTTLAELTVHVAGAVRRPGVYQVAPGSRVIDVIDKAGGATPKGDADALNLAATLADGSRVYVPRAGEPAAVDGAAPDPAAAGSTNSGTAAASGPTPSAPIDINQAGAAELESLPGIGPATAAAIIEYRTSNGPFAAVDDLESVPGIGPAKLDAVRDLVIV